MDEKYTLWDEIYKQTDVTGLKQMWENANVKVNYCANKFARTKALHKNEAGGSYVREFRVSRSFRWR